MAARTSWLALGRAAEAVVAAVHTSSSARCRAGEAAASVKGWERKEGNVVSESAAVVARLHRVTRCRAAGVVATDVWVRRLARCWAAEATAGAEGRGAATQTRDGRVGVREWAPI